MCTLFAYLYVLLTWGPHMVYMGTPYIFDIYMIRCGWLGRLFMFHQRLSHHYFSYFSSQFTTNRHSSHPRLLQCYFSLFIQVYNVFSYNFIAPQCSPQHSSCRAMFYITIFAEEQCSLSQFLHEFLSSTKFTSSDEVLA